MAGTVAVLAIGAVMIRRNRAAVLAPFRRAARLKAGDADLEVQQ